MRGTHLANKIKNKLQKNEHKNFDYGNNLWRQKVCGGSYEILLPPIQKLIDIIKEFDDMIKYTGDKGNQYKIERDEFDIESLRDRFILNQFFKQSQGLKKNKDINYIL